MPINMPTRVNRVPRLGQPTSYASRSSSSYGNDELPPSPSGGLPQLRTQIPQDDAFSMLPGGPAKARSRVQNFPAIGTGVLAGANGVRNQGSLNAGQGVMAIPTQQPSYVARPADNPFPYEHDYGTGNSRAFDVSMQNLRDRQRSATSLLNRNIGAGGYGGIGGMTQGAYDQQSAMIDPLIAAHRQQQAQNNYSQWDRDRLRLAMAPRKEELPPLAPGLIGPDGQRVAPPPMSQYAGRTVGGTPVSASTSRASQLQAVRDAAMKEIIARRSARMTGRPLLPQFRPQQNQQSPLNQKVVVGADGRIIQGQPTASAIPQASAGGTATGSVASGGGIATKMVPNPEFVDTRGVRKTPFDMVGEPPPVVPFNDGPQLQHLMPFMSGLGNSIGSWWAGIPSGPARIVGSPKPRGGAGAYDPRVTPQNYDIW